MTSKEHYFFNLLKKQIVSVYSKNNVASKNIEDWKGENIVSFQEDLFQKTKGKVSEKWFYTYFKNTPEKLPRIDILNLLSIYVNCKNWEEFKVINKKKKQKKTSFVVIFILILLTLVFGLKQENTFQLCFVDEDKNEAILTSLQIELLNEKNVVYSTDSLGCFNHKTKKDEILFVVSSSYYKRDTIVRHINNLNSTIQLSVDDYALMLDYYANNKLRSWNERKRELEKLIDKDAIIYQFYSKSLGVEIYTKEEFINLLVIPTNSLQRVEILNKEFKNNKIVKLKFIIR